MTLRILYRCVRCGAIATGEWYDLRQMFGRSAVCAPCEREAA